MKVAQDEILVKQEKFISLRAEGNSYRTIAKKLKVGKDTLKRWESSLGEKLSEAKKERLESVYIQFGMYKEARVKGLGNLLLKVEKEVENRDLSDVPTDKLLELNLKIRKELKEEFSPIQGTEKKDLVETIKESVSILTTRIASGELSSENLKVETASLLALEKAQESLPQDVKSDGFDFRIMTAEESLANDLQKVRLEAELMLSDEEQRELVNKKLDEIEQMKKEYENLISSEKYKLSAYNSVFK